MNSSPPPAKRLSKYAPLIHVMKVCLLLSFWEMLETRFNVYMFVIPILGRKSIVINQLYYRAWIQCTEQKNCRSKCGFFTDIFLLFCSIDIYNWWWKTTISFFYDICLLSRANYYFFLYVCFFSLLVLVFF